MHKILVCAAILTLLAGLATATPGHTRDVTASTDDDEDGYCASDLSAPARHACDTDSDGDGLPTALDAIRSQERGQDTGRTIAAGQITDITRSTGPDTDHTGIGDRISALARGIEKGDIRRGMVIAQAAAEQTGNTAKFDRSYGRLDADVCDDTHGEIHPRCIAHLTINEEGVEEEAGENQHSLGVSDQTASDTGINKRDARTGRNPRLTNRVEIGGTMVEFVSPPGQDTNGHTPQTGKAIKIPAK